MSDTRSEVDASTSATAQETASPQERELHHQVGIVLSAYKQMLLSLFVATLIVIVALFVMILPFFISYFVENNKTAAEPSIFLIVILAGSLGAFFSALMRLYDVEELPKALVSDQLRGLNNIHLLIYSLVPAIVGAIAAAVVYLTFAARMLEGDLFPKFVCKLATKDCHTFTTFMSWGPDDAPDYAKALIWGFIAGFAERFVPDTLGALAKSTRDSPTR